MQIIITMIITYNKAKPGASSNSNIELNELIPKDEEDSKTIGCCAKFKGIHHTKCFKMFQDALIVWQAVSIIAIFILDMLQIKNMQKLYTNRIDRYWCSCTILFASSNSKTLFSYFVLVPCVFLDETKCLQYTERIKIVWGISKFKYYVILAAAVLGFVEFVWLIVPILLGIGLYVWVGIAGHITWICACFCKKQSRHKYKKAGMYIVAYLIFFLWTICGPCYINFNFGVGYIESFICVMTERNWTSYINSITSNVESAFRFLTMVF
eukprot:151020_1